MECYCGKTHFRYVKDVKNKKNVFCSDYCYWVDYFVCFRFLSALIMKLSSWFYGDQIDDCFYTRFSMATAKAAGFHPIENLSPGFDFSNNDLTDYKDPIIVYPGGMHEVQFNHRGAVYVPGIRYKHGLGMIPDGFKIQSVRVWVDDFWWIFTKVSVVWYYATLIILIVLNTG